MLLIYAFANQLLLVLVLRLIVLDEGFGLLGGRFPHLLQLVLDVNASGIHLLPNQALLHILPSQQSLDFVLVEGDPLFDCGRLQLLADEKAHSFLNQIMSTE